MQHDIRSVVVCGSFPSEAGLGVKLRLFGPNDDGVATSKTYANCSAGHQNLIRVLSPWTQSCSGSNNQVSAMHLCIICALLFALMTE